LAFRRPCYHGHITLRIYDDGTGMTEPELLNAMRYRAKARPTNASLGKFGLGLKTASTAFCRRLVVTSRGKPNDPLITAVWDLDHIRDSNKWQITIGASSEKETKLFDEILAGKKGTLVLWDKVDRVMKSYKDPAGGPAKKAFEKVIEGASGLRQHLAMVYQRLVDGEDTRGANIELTLNGTAVEARDPFSTGESKSEGDESIPVEMPDGGVARFRIRAFILPRKEEFSSEEAWRNARLG